MPKARSRNPTEAEPGTGLESKHSIAKRTQPKPSKASRANLNRPASASNKTENETENPPYRNIAAERPVIGLRQSKLSGIAAKRDKTNRKPTNTQNKKHHEHDSSQQSGILKQGI